MTTIVCLPSWAAGSDGHGTGPAEQLQLGFEPAPPGEGCLRYLHPRAAERAVPDTTDGVWEGTDQVRSLATPGLRIYINKRLEVELCASTPPKRLNHFTCHLTIFSWKNVFWNRHIKPSQNYLQYTKLAQYACLSRNPCYPRFPLTTWPHLFCEW